MHDNDDFADNGDDDDIDYILCTKRRSKTPGKTALLNGFRSNGHSPGLLHKR